MTDLLLRFPVQAFLVGLALLVGEIVWVFYLIVESISAHRKWNRAHNR